MTVPLVMLGPGGDYQTRFDIRGLRLVRTVGQATAQDGGGESSGGFAGYSRLPRRGRDGQANDLSDGAPASQVSPQVSPTVQRRPDAFERTAPTPAIGLYAPPATPAATTALAGAIEAWLAMQLRALGCVHHELAKLSPPKTPKTPEIPTPWAHTVSAASPPSVAAAAPVAAVGYIATLPPSPAGSHPLTSPVEPSHESQPDTQATQNPHPYPRLPHGSRLFTDYGGTGRRVGREQGHRVRAHRGLNQKRRLAAASAQGALFGG